MTDRTHCYQDATCVRAYLHSGPHTPGCRACGTTDHTADDCPEQTMTEGFKLPHTRVIPPLIPPTAQVPPPAIPDTERCAQCRSPFNPDDTRFNGNARHRGRPEFCGYCVDQCSLSSAPFHRCAVCA